MKSPDEMGPAERGWYYQQLRAQQRIAAQEWARAMGRQNRSGSGGGMLACVLLLLVGGFGLTFLLAGMPTGAFVGCFRAVSLIVAAVVAYRFRARRGILWTVAATEALFLLMSL